MSQLAKRITKTTLPYGTLFVNLVGAFLLGLFVGFDIFESLYLLGGVGFLGAFTTFSTFQLELVQMFDQKKWKPFLLYSVISYGIGLLFAIAGFYIGSF